MNHHLLANEEKEELQLATVKPRVKKYEYQIALFGGSEPATCQYFDPKGKICAEVQPDTSHIANGYRKLSWAIKIFAFVARLAIRKVKFWDHPQSNIINIQFKKSV